MTIAPRPGVMGQETQMRPERARRGPEMKRGRISWPEVWPLVGLMMVAAFLARSSDAEVKAKARKVASEVDAKVQQISPTLQAMMERYDPNNPRNRWWATQLTPTQLVEVTQKRAEYPTATPTPFRPEPTKTSTPIPTPTDIETPTPEATPTVDQEAIQAQIDEKIAFIQETVEELYGTRKEVEWPSKYPLRWGTYSLGVYFALGEMPWLMIQRLDPDIAEALEELIRLGADVQLGIYGNGWGWYEMGGRHGAVYEAIFIIDWGVTPGKIQSMDDIVPLTEGAQEFLKRNKRMGVTYQDFLGSGAYNGRYSFTENGIVVWVNGRQVVDFLIGSRHVRGRGASSDPDVYEWDIRPLPSQVLDIFEEVLSEQQ